ncbi:MAG: hypothetical protein ACT6R9_14810, partial [Methylophilus sp.]|uniref:hypothetical protein n=1 Tax=Methylophilus sp. TaxID=29541 RepID=UPI0040372C12
MARGDRPASSSSSLRRQGHYEAQYHPQALTGLGEHVLHDAGTATRFTHNTQRPPTLISSQDLVWERPKVQSFRYDALGSMVCSVRNDGALITAAYDGTQRRVVNIKQRLTRLSWHTALHWVWAQHGTRDLITHIGHSSSRGLQSYQHANGTAASSAHDQAARRTQWADGPLKTTLGFNPQAQLKSIKTQTPERPGPTMAALVLR